MRAALVIARKDLRQRFRDRSAVVLGFIAPLAIATLMSFAFQTSQEFSFSMGLVDEDGAPVAAAFAGVLGAPELADVVTVEPLASAPEARARVDDGSVDAAVVVPEGFSEGVTTADPDVGASLRIFTSADAPLAAQVTRAIAEGFLAQVNANRLSIATAVAAGAPLAETADLAAAVTAERLPEQVAREPVGGEELRTITYFAPGMAIFFVLFAVGFAARSFFTEREQGTLERMAAAPVSRRAILSGKAVSVFVYAIASLGTMALVTGLVFDADWGHPAAAAALITAIAASVVTLTALVIALARTDRQAEGLASILIFALALLGGNFIFISAAPPLMRSLSLATPNGWALRAFTDLGTTAGDMAHDLDIIAGPLIGILVFTLVVGAVAAVLSRRVALR